MQNKPVKHKSGNVFQFKKFAERVSEIDIRRAVLYHIDYVGEDEPEENESYFYLALQKWKVLNLTDEFDNFHRGVKDIVTLPQLLLKKEHVFEHLFDCLQTATTLSLQALLEIVAVLAKELQEYFCEWLPKILYKLLSLLKDKDAEIVEWTLVCLAFLFKYLKKHLKKDIGLVLNLVMPVLDEKQPEHIQNFAIECFSYVARDIKDKNHFFEVILKFCSDHGNVTKSCGQLFFQIVRGIPGQFHSSAEYFLSSCLDLFMKFNEKNATVFKDLFNYCLDAMMPNISPKAMVLLWDLLVQRVGKGLKEEKSSSLPVFLGFTLKLIEYRKGFFLSDHKKLINLILEGLKKENNCPDLERIYCNLIIAILNAQTINLGHLEANDLIRAMLKTKDYDNFRHFVKNTLSCSQFEQIIMPAFLESLDSGTFPIDEPALELIVEILIQKSPPQRDGIDLGYIPNQMKFAKCPNLDKILDEKLNVPIETMAKDAQFQLTLLIQRYKSPKDVTREVKLRIFKQSKAILSDLINKTDFDKPLFFLYSLMIEFLIAVNHDKLDLVEMVLQLLPFCSGYKTVEALRLVDLLLAKCPENNLTIDLFNRLHPVLGENLCSPFHTMRLLSVNSLQKFRHLEELNKKIGGSGKELFIYDLIYRVESTESSIETYRGQLQLLQKFTFDTVYYQALAQDSALVKRDPLKYLLGVLNLNFKLIWQPTMDIIKSYALNMGVDDFWTIYKRQLQLDLSSDMIQVQYPVENDILRQLFSFEEPPKYRPDFINYRKHIWSMLPNFGNNLLERKNKELITMFLDFYQTQYRPHCQTMANVRRNLMQFSQIQETQDDNDGEKDDLMGQNEELDRDEESKVEHDQDEEEEDEESEEEDKDSENEKEEDDEVEEQEMEQENRLLNKSYTSELINYLSILQNMPNPRTIYKSAEMYRIYMELLSSRNANVQSLALDCILAYKDKNLVAYAEHLHNFIDEKKFRDELNSFALAGPERRKGKGDGDEEEKGSGAVVVPEHHRNSVMQIVMRILYGKMYTRLVGQQKKKRGKMNVVQARKQTVIRYMNGCTDEELLAFIGMCFRPFEELLAESDLDECLNQAEQEMAKLEDALRPKYLHSCLKMVEMMMNQFGLRGDLILSQLLKLILIIQAVVQKVIENNVTTGSRLSGMSTYKGLRKEVTLLLRHFFDQFDGYGYKSSEIEHVFRLFVWPGCEKLAQESQATSSPVALLKLFFVWSKTPRYFSLLINAGRVSDGHRVNPLNQIMSLLHKTPSHTKIANTIFDMVCNLLTIEAEEEATTSSSSSFDYLLDPTLLTEQQKRVQEKGLNFGSMILIPHLDVLVEKIHSKIGHGRAKEVGKRDFTILNRITELVEDKGKSDILLSLLLPVLTKKTKTITNDTQMAQLINSLIRLLKKTDHPEKHIRIIAPLFEELTMVGPRKLLCDLYVAIEKSEHSNLVIELNALNKRWVGQPDYDRRLAAFKVIDELIVSETMDINLSLIVLYHAFYFLRHDKDLAMRSTSSYCLKKTVLYLAGKYQNDPKEKKYLFETVILSIIKRGIASQEKIKNECISILGDLSRNYPNIHFVFADLNPLTNATDKEVDFFENMIHMQTHRQARALTKFIQFVAKSEGEVSMNPRTLTDYVYPMAVSYLCNETYTSNNALIDTAIDCVAAVCKLLPFYQYQTILRVFIKKLKTNIEFQKQMVKLVVAIIDVFHFDFSEHEEKLSQPIVSNKKPEQKRDFQKVKNKKFKGKKGPIKKNTKPDSLDTSKNEIEGDNDEEEVEETEIGKELKEVEKESKELLKEETKKEHHSHTDYILMIGLVQSLNNSILELSSRDSSHKANKKNSQFEEEELLRVPIALATTQLLFKVSKKLLDQSLPKIFLKMCSFLKSRLKSVRIITRDVLRKIMLVLGPSYLHVLVDLLTSLLRRGFQVHVLVVTLHNILESLKPKFTAEDMDNNLSRILNVCMEDVFGQAAEEKEVVKIGNKTPEAKTSSKSYLILNILATRISENCLLDLLVPFKGQLSRTNSAKVVTKVQICLNKIITGLMENHSITNKSYLMFIYGVLNENIANLKFILSETKAQKMEKALPDRLKKADIYLIADEQSAMKKRDSLIKKSALTNAHVLNEFALGLLQMVIKNEKVDIATFQAFVNPIAENLVDLLTGSSQVRVITLVLKCISVIWNRQIELANIVNAQNRIVERMFEILKKYSSQDLTQNSENYQLIRSSFKAIMSLIRFVDNYQIDADQLKLLLFYVEQDLHSKQAIAFPLLRAIIAKKMFVPEINDTVAMVSKLCITADSEAVREEARQILITFFLEYPVGDKFATHLKFFVSQLGYEVPSGRESAIKMLLVIMKKIPKTIIQKNISFLFLTLGARMVNDDRAEIRVLVSKCVEELISRSDKRRREQLFDMVLALMEDRQASHIEMAALFCGRFLAAEQSADFAKRVPKLLPLVVQKLTTAPTTPHQSHEDNEEEEEEEDGKREEEKGRFVREIGTVDLDNNNEGALWRTKAHDHQLIQLLNLVIKLLEQYPELILVSGGDFGPVIDQLAYGCQRLLAYGHTWVRLNAAKVIGIVLQASDFELLRKCLEKNDDENEEEDSKFPWSYLYWRPQSEIRSLVLDLCAQLRPEQVEPDMAEEVMKDLLVVATIIKEVPLEDVKLADAKIKRVNLIWLIRRLNYAANAEVIHSPHSTVLRCAIFHWIEGLLNVIGAGGKELVSGLAGLLLAPVAREISPDNNNTHAELKRLGQKISAKMKKLLGEMELNEVMNRLQQRQMVKRSERKTKAVLEKIQNPEKAAKRRASQQQSKKMAKRRKMDVIKGKAAPRKRKRQPTEDDDFM